MNGFDSRRLHHILSLTYGYIWPQKHKNSLDS